MDKSLQLLKQEVENLKNTETEMHNMSNIKIYQLILLKYAQQQELYGMVLYDCQITKYYENSV